MSYLKIHPHHIAKAANSRNQWSQCLQKVYK